MSFSIPDLKVLSQRARNAFRANMKGTDSWIWPSNTYVTAKVFAGIVYMLFQRLAWVDKQRFAATAFGDNLDKIGSELSDGSGGFLGRKAAGSAQGYIDFPASYPFTVPKNTIVTRSDNVTFITTQDVSAIPYSNTGTIVVPVVCQTVGKIGNTIAGTTLATTLAGLDAGTTTVTVNDAGIGQGADAESDDLYQQRILERKRQPPMGGCEYDYVRWAKQMPGVTRVWVTGNAFGLGTVGIWFLMDGTYPFGIPQPSDVAAVQAYIDTQAPVTAIPIVLAPIADCLAIQVKGVYPDTQTTRLSVAAEMLAVFTNMTQPGLPGQPFVLRHSWLEQAVNNATSEQYNEGVPMPAADMPFGVGVVPCLASVTFVP